MKNPDGHNSQLSANLPIHIFLSPQLPIDDDNNLVHEADQRLALTAPEMADFTPPQYGEHVLDRLYDDIDESGYRTPAATSGVNTPTSLHGRNLSLESLAPPTTVGNDDISVNTLQNNLGSLEIAGSAGAHRTTQEIAVFDFRECNRSDHTVAGDVD